MRLTNNTLGKSLALKAKLNPKGNLKKACLEHNLCAGRISCKHTSFLITMNCDAIPPPTHTQQSLAFCQLKFVLSIALAPTNEEIRKKTEGVKNSREFHNRSVVRINREGI